MNARSFWDNDGYSFYNIADRSDALQFIQAYAITGLPAAKFTDGVDFTGFKPIPSTSTSGAWGGRGQCLGVEKT